MASHSSHNLAYRLSTMPAWLRARLGTSWRALALRTYRQFWIGQVISFTGTWMQITAQAWLALQLTSSPLTLSLVTTLRFLPVLLLMLIGGEIADRLPRRQLFLVTQTGALIHAILFGLLVTFGLIELWHLYVLSLVGGIIAALDGPAEQAFVAELVDDAYMSNAIAGCSRSCGCGYICLAATGSRVHRHSVSKRVFLQGFPLSSFGQRDIDTGRLQIGMS
jgi:MFS family permease